MDGVQELACQLTPEALDTVIGGPCFRNAELFTDRIEIKCSGICLYALAACMLGGFWKDGL